MLRRMPKLRTASYRVPRLVGDGRYYEDTLPHTVPAIEALDTVASVLEIKPRGDGDGDGAY